jgi:photosystem II stability/assembly factor-like uncharacterized protein
MRPAILLALSLTAVAAQAQWTLEDAHTTASFRGIQAVSPTIAWASGSSGTVVRTIDGGTHWQSCAIPPDAEKLDFRGLQALNADIAIVMSSGKDDLSRIYKTTDGCRIWKLLFTNPDKEGFWDGIQYDKTTKRIIILGDPVAGKFKLYSFSAESPATLLTDISEPTAAKGQSIFAASNTSMMIGPTGGICFVTGGTAAEMICTPLPDQGPAVIPQTRSTLLLATGGSAGGFSLTDSHSSKRVAVGGDYQQPDSSTASASWSDNWGLNWHPAQTSPHGYRSAVAYDPAHKLWITVGPNGTDISTDDGKNWRALKPLPGQPNDADQHWNALSLPFVVGPKGRIGKLTTNALQPPTK